MISVLSSVGPVLTAYDLAGGSNIPRLPGWVYEYCSLCRVPRRLLRYSADVGDTPDIDRTARRNAFSFDPPVNYGRLLPGLIPT
jgi:hypothetical protein